MIRNVDVYGTEWCEDTQHTRQQLQELGVAYQFINIEADPEAARWVKEQNDGKQKTPTVKVVRDVLSVPDEGSLEQALRGNGLLH